MACLIHALQKKSFLFLGTPPNRPAPSSLSLRDKSLSDPLVISPQLEGSQHNSLSPTWALQPPGTYCVASNVPVPAGWTGVFFSMLSFLFFTDMGIYWIHRGLHHKHFYKV